MCPMFSVPVDCSFFITLPVFSNVFKRAMFKFRVSYGNNVSEFRKTRYDCFSIINKIWTSVSRFNYIILISEWKLLFLLLPFGYYFNHSLQQRMFANPTSIVDALREYCVKNSSSLLFYYKHHEQTTPVFRQMSQSCSPILKRGAYLYTVSMWQRSLSKYTSYGQCTMCALLLHVLSR